jgi:Lon protease-like protein
MPGPLDTHPRLSAVPLFPLPNVVLFPRAILPLHIFEERYKQMTSDALDSDGQIAMALLRPGWEKNYYSKPAIEPVVCVGRILTHERMPDGKYNFLLQGTMRAKIAREHPTNALAYRTAELIPLEETPVMEIDLGGEREKLISLFAEDELGQTAVGRQFAQMLSSPLATADIVDLIAFNFLEDFELKQTLLADTDVRRRVGRTVRALEDLVPMLLPSQRGGGSNPSMY